MLILCLTDKENLPVVGVCVVGNFHGVISFLSPEPNPSTHEQCFPGLLGLNALAHTSPVFQKEKERENQQISQEQPG